MEGSHSNYGQRIFSFRNTKKVHYDVYIRKPNKLHYGEGVYGLCFDPEDENPHILINPRQSDRSMMNTCIHEVCHAFFWDKSEYDISRCASTLSNLIFKLGWRKVEDINLEPSKKNRKKAKARKGKK